jgi:transcriptional regulator with XRE-family HTH domain
VANVKEILAQNLKKHRKRLGITQPELAEKVATSANYIAQIEQKNRFPTPEMLEK